MCDTTNSEVTQSTTTTDATTTTPKCAAPTVDAAKSASTGNDKSVSASPPPTRTAATAEDTPPPAPTSVNSTKSEAQQQQKSAKASHSPTRQTTAPADVKLAAVSPTAQLAPKHKLQNKWSLWYDTRCDTQRRQDAWGGGLRKLIDFEFAEDFWGIFKQLLPASKVVSGTDYHMFKAGIEPRWEDPANTQGGKWSLSVPKRQPNATRGPPSIDDLWLTTLLGCIGEQFGQDSDEICGVVVSIRKPADRICLWMRDNSNETAVVAAGAAFRQLLGVPDVIKTSYQFHSESIKRNLTASRGNP
ncbi:eukaryotic translation initiation factor 4E [Pelomyxa schiedti]|nr:eukaryotic translation initiation factor 4E [Pelomyxa schiedti]